MTEYALPFPGTSIGDAGPYPVGGATIPGWWDKAYLMNRAGGRLAQTTLADVGVYYSVDDQLECTEAADTISIDVDTGASLVDGTLHYNDTDPVNVPIPAAAAGLDRIDLVVVRKNYSAVTTYTPGGGAPTVGPRECRITVIRGTEAAGPVAPTVTQDTTRATYWDIPLCSVQVDDGGTLSSLTDLREYADAETKKLLLPFVGGITDGLTDLLFNSSVGIPLADAVQSDVTAVWTLAEDFIDDLVMTPIVVNPSATTGNIVAFLTVRWETCDEAWNSNTSGGVPATIAIAANNAACLTALDLSPAIASDDFVHMILTRSGAAGADTFAGTVYGLGMRIEYLGWK